MPGVTVGKHYSSGRMEGSRGGCPTDPPDTRSRESRIHTITKAASTPESSPNVIRWHGAAGEEPSQLLLGDDGMASPNADEPRGPGSAEDGAAGGGFLTETTMLLLAGSSSKSECI